MSFRQNGPLILCMFHKHLLAFNVNYFPSRMRDRRKKSTFSLVKLIDKHQFVTVQHGIYTR